MKATIASAVASLALAAHAQSGPDVQCPNATATPNSVAFPLDLPAATKTDEAVVEFTIVADGWCTRSAQRRQVQVPPSFKVD